MIAPNPRFVRDLPSRRDHAEVLTGRGGDPRLGPQSAGLTGALLAVVLSGAHETFEVKETRMRISRVRFGTGSTSLQSQTFGVLTSNSDLLNTPRQMQFVLKLYF